MNAEIEYIQQRIAEMPNSVKGGLRGRVGKVAVHQRS